VRGDKQEMIRHTLNGVGFGPLHLCSALAASPRMENGKL